MTRPMSPEMMTGRTCSYRTGGGLVNRVMRMGIGLVALIPVLGLAGWLFGAAGVEGEAAAWAVLGAGLVWIVLMIWWALRAPAQIGEESRGRYFAFLRQAQYRPLEHTDSDDKRDRR